MRSRWYRIFVTSHEHVAKATNKLTVEAEVCEFDIILSYVCPGLGLRLFGPPVIHHYIVT